MSNTTRKVSVLGLRILEVTDRRPVCVKGENSRQRLRGVEIFKRTGAKIVPGLKIFPRLTEARREIGCCASAYRGFSAGHDRGNTESDSICESEHIVLSYVAPERKPIGLSGDGHQRLPLGMRHQHTPSTSSHQQHTFPVLSTLARPRRYRLLWESAFVPLPRCSRR
ncbi:hypothetical protein BDW02DRAFT_97133 [Decorospora gaudefroyi]|uniref:Uncharacterized protein n=1 Tax=Decorospora gaudefroyi TaxID=184978 RepID=A0A6A5KS46_9PLEO|nr:hypothetical protein BDW02DRAFT_97133 [Decorospora gaudefroyi]